jgi:hypothetical protein
MSSFVSESSDYTAGGGDGGGEEEDVVDSNAPRRSGSTNQDAPTMEHEVVGMSRNNVGSRWVALVWDKALEATSSSEAAPARGPWELHFDRISRTEEHVLFCRKQNLYNETFNLESRADIVWSYPMYVSYI